MGSIHDIFGRRRDPPEWQALATEKESRYVTDPRTARFPTHLLLPLRAWVGLTWLVNGWRKLTLHGGWTDHLLTAIHRSTPHPLFASFVSEWVAPNAALFSGLVSWGEFLVGLSIVCGAASRFGAGVGMFLSATYMLLQNRFFPGYDGTLFVAQFVLLVGASGRVLGVDTFLHRRWPDVPFW